MRESALTDKTRMAQFLAKYKASRGAGSQGYADFMKARTKTSDSAYAAALSDARIRHERSLAGYGVDGEQLMRRGGADGYAAYLDNAADARLLSDTRQAERSYTADRESENQDYREYLESRATALRTTINSMRMQGIRNYNDAYAYTLTAGFDSDTAHLAADLVGAMEAKPLNVNAQNMRKNLLEQMVRLSLPRDAAYRYALSCGISAEEAAELADACELALGRYTETLY